MRVNYTRSQTVTHNWIPDTVTSRMEKTIEDQSGACSPKCLKSEAVYGVRRAVGGSHLGRGEHFQALKIPHGGCEWKNVCVVGVQW